MRPQGVGRSDSVGEIQYRMLVGKPKPRPNEYMGITFRSKLELRFSWYLTDLGIKWQYEPRRYGPRGRSYLPDFQLEGIRPTFVEFKPTRREVGPAAKKMSIIWETHPDALLIIACEEGRAFFAAYSDSEWREWNERWA